MKQVNVLLTPGGGPGILAQLVSLKKSKKYSARAILADSNPASGNLFLPQVDARYQIPLCSSADFIPAILRIIKKEGIDFYYSGLDEEMPVLARNRTALEEAGCRLMLPEANALDNALDKKVTHEIMEGKVLKPRTWFLDENVDVSGVYEELRGKVLIKVASSRGGRHIYIPGDGEEYVFYVKRALKLHREREMNFMVEEFIEGSEYNVTTLHNNGGNLIYAISRRKFESRKVKSTTTAAVIEKREDVVDQAVTVVEAMGLVPGFNNVESIVSDKNGKPYFIEVNGGRTAAQDMNIVAAGVNITDLMIDICLGNDLKPIPHPPDGICTLKIRKDVVVDYEDILSTLVA